MPWQVTHQCLWTHHSICLNDLCCLCWEKNIHIPSRLQSFMYLVKKHPQILSLITDYSFSCEVSVSSIHFHYSEYYSTVNNFLNLKACLSYHAISSLWAGIGFELTLLVVWEVGMYKLRRTDLYLWEFCELWQEYLYHGNWQTLQIRTYFSEF